jgi:hypothetical protein
MSNRRALLVSLAAFEVCREGRVMWKECCAAQTAVFRSQARLVLHVEAKLFLCLIHLASHHEVVWGVEEQLRLSLPKH